MKTILALFLALAMVGCATNDYKAYADAQANMATAKANADTARYNALSEIAKTGTESSKIAAVMALAFGTGGTTQVSQVQAPQASSALQWASILVPGLTQAYAISRSADVSINSSNNAMLTSSATTAAFVGIAGKIQAPVVTVPQANVTTTTTSTDNHASNVTSANPTTTTTLSGTGTLGSGAYSTQANPVTTTSTANPVTTTTTTNPATNIPAGVVCGVSVAGTVNCIP